MNDWQLGDQRARLEFRDENLRRYLVIEDFEPGEDIKVVVQRWINRHPWRFFTARKVRAAVHEAVLFAHQHQTP